MMHTISTPYVQTYTNFWLACLDAEWHERTCNYWYTVTSGATAHTAFRTKEELMQWLDERDLKLTDSLPDEVGTFKSMPIEGIYKSASYMDIEAFEAIIPLFTVGVMDNAEYTLGKVTEDKAIRTVHYLNVNVRERVVLPYIYK